MPDPNVPDDDAVREAIETLRHDPPPSLALEDRRDRDRQREDLERRLADMQHRLDAAAPRPTATEPRDEGEVTRVVNDLATLTEVAHAELSKLEGRMLDVLTGSPVQPDDEVTVAARTPLGERLRHRHHELDVLIARLVDLRERLEL